MSDLDDIRALLTRVGIVYKEGERELEVTAKTGPKNLGYTGFCTVLTFDAEGNLIEWGSWE